MNDAVWRDVHRGRVWRAQACRIVEESPELVVLWIPAGTPAKIPRGGLRIPVDDWELEDAGTSRDQVCLARPGRAHSIYLFWRENGELEHWYVNFEQPLRRTPLGFDTFDEKLDLIVRPDGSYRWKDEDELEQAAARRAARPGRRALRGGPRPPRWPFPTGWEDWRPDPAWPIPQLPEGWDRV